MDVKNKIINDRETPSSRLNSARDNENTEKSILIQISRDSITNMQAHIAILRRMLWLELFIMAGSLLPTNHRQFWLAKILFTLRSILRFTRFRLYLWSRIGRVFASKYPGGPTIHAETVCQGPVTSTSTENVGACNGYNGPGFRSILPKIGQHVMVTGRYLIEMPEMPGGITELHPVYEIMILP